MCMKSAALYVHYVLLFQQFVKVCNLYIVRLYVYICIHVYCANLSTFYFNELLFVSPYVVVTYIYDAKLVQMIIIVVYNHNNYEVATHVTNGREK